MAKLLQNLKIREVSSVARGAGKGVRIMLMKMAEDGSQPLDIPAFLPPAKNETLDNTLDRMFEMSAQHGVPPENVAKARKALTKSIAEIEKHVDEPERQAALEKSLSQCADYLSGLVPVEKAEAFLAAVSAFTPKESDMKPEEIAKAIADAVAAAVGPLQKGLNDSAATISSLSEQIAIGKLSKEHQDYVTFLKSDDAAAAIGESADKVSAFVTKFLAADEAGRERVIKAFPPKKKPPFPPKGEEDGSDIDKAIAKALETSPVMVELRKDNETLRKLVDAGSISTKVAEFAKKAKDLGLPEAHGEVMRKAYGGDAEAQVAHEAMLRGIANQARTGQIFKEFGSGGDQAGATAYDTIKAKAVEFQKAHPELSVHQARDRIMRDPMNKELVQQHRDEERRQRAA